MKTKDKQQLIKEQIQDLFTIIDNLEHLKSKLADLYVLVSPHYKIEFVVKYKDDEDEYTYKSRIGYRFTLRDYIDRAEAEVNHLAERYPFVKAYIWQNIPYEEVNEELLGKYEPAAYVLLDKTTPGKVVFEIG